jgi:hypothetical protein
MEAMDMAVTVYDTFKAVRRALDDHTIVMFHRQNPSLMNIYDRVNRLRDG